MTRPATSIRKVVQVDQSSTSEVRWRIALECGHTYWITSVRRKPAMKIMACAECARLEKAR